MAYVVRGEDGMWQVRATETDEVLSTWETEEEANAEMMRLNNEASQAGAPPAAPMA